MQQNVSEKKLFRAGKERRPGSMALDSDSDLPLGYVTPRGEEMARKKWRSVAARVRVVTMQIAAIAEMNKGGLTESIATSAQSLSNQAEIVLPGLDLSQISRSEERLPDIVYLLELFSVTRYYT